jgi:hypothetical protein
MASSPVAPVSVAPVSMTAAALRVQILGAAEAELLAVLGAVQEPDAPAPRSATAAAAPANPVTQAVDAARSVAAGQQASLAPLFADLALTLSVPNLPGPIKAAIGQVLALQLPADGPIAPEDVRQAVARSGLFLEADLAAPGTPASPDLKAALLTLRQLLPAPAPAAAPGDAPSPIHQTAPPAQAPPSQDPAPVAPPQSAAPATPLPLPQAQTAQAGPEPLSAELAQVPTTSAPPGAAEAPTGQTPPPRAPASAATPPPAPPQTAALSGPPPQAAPASILPGPSVPLDPKTALLTLQQAPPAAPGGDPPADPPPQDLKAALLALRQAMRDPAADTPAPAQRPAPPAREAGLSPQAPAPATLPERADLSALAEHLRPQVEQALARLTLHQLASLPDGASGGWMFEIPVATPQGTAMAQFEIERGGAGSGGGGDAAQPWRARFSIDIEPLGPVHVHVAMSGGKAAVSVWAERADSLEWLRGQGAELAGALPAEVVFRGGAPPGAAPARGHFLDQTS